MEIVQKIIIRILYGHVNLLISKRQIIFLFFEIFILFFNIFTSKKNVQYDSKK